MLDASGEWTALRAGGAVAHRDEGLALDLRPRVMLEYTARVRDAVAYALFAGDSDPTAWVGDVLVRVCGGHLQSRPLMDSMSGAYPLGDEVTPLANAELAPLGIEVAVTTCEIALSDEDREALEQAVTRAAMANLEAAGFKVD